MSVVTSVISATDLELFKNLANPAKVDIRQNPQNNRNTKPDIPPTTINGGGNDDDTLERNPSREHSRSHSQSRSRSRSQSRSQSNSRPSPPPHKQRNSSAERQDRHPSASSMSLPVSPPPSSHGHSHSPSPSPSHPSSPPKEKTKQKTSSHRRRHDRSPDQRRSSSPDGQIESGFRSSYPDITQRAIPDHNPFKSSFDSPFPPRSSRRSPDQQPSAMTRRPSLFDQETQRYLRESSPDVRVKLPFRDRGPTMSIPPTAAHPRLFSPNPLNNPNILDPVLSPRRESHSRRQNKHHHSRHSRHSQNSRHSRHSRSKHRHSNSRHSRHSRSKHRHRHSNSRRHEDEFSNQEKRKYLLDLEKLKLQGIKLTKDYTMNDSLADIRFEYDSHRSNYDVVDSINYMKDILGFSFTLIESLNQRFGPILQLRGWSTYMKNNMGRFDRLLERAYHRFWRQGQPSPFMEFGFLVFGTMIMWHLQNKYLNGLPVGEMLGVMGGGGGSGGSGSGGSGGNVSSGGNGTNNSRQNMPSGGGANMPSGSGGLTNTSGNAGGGFSLGNIMRMFTGGNANRPSPPQANPNPSQPMPSIIPPIPNPPVTPAQRSQVSQIPTASAPVPPSGIAATLPPMNVRGISSQSPSQTSQSNPSDRSSDRPPQRRMLRRPSAHLREEGLARAPLSPVQESTHESDIPAPP